MGRYVNVVARKECVDQINELYRRAFPGEQFLVYSKAEVEREVQWCQSDAAPQHLRYITTPEQWNETFPIHAELCGQIFIESERTDDESALLKAKVEWVIANRMLFDEVTGLQDADILGIDAGEHVTGFKKGAKVVEKPVSFDDLPVETCAIYLLCKQADRPDLWKAFVAFRKRWTLEGWYEIRSMVVPGSRMRTVWQRVELLHGERTGVKPSLTGHFVDQRPTVIMVEMAITASEASITGIEHRLNMFGKQS